MSIRILRIQSSASITGLLGFQTRDFQGKLEGQSGLTGCRARSRGRSVLSLHLADVHSPDIWTGRGLGDDGGAPERRGRNADSGSELPCGLGRSRVLWAEELGLALSGVLVWNLACCEHCDLAPPSVVSHFVSPSCFTDAFVNSQEWTLSRSVPELKVVSAPRPGQ